MKPKLCHHKPMTQTHLPCNAARRINEAQPCHRNGWGKAQTAHTCQQYRYSSERGKDEKKKKTQKYDQVGENTFLKKCPSAWKTREVRRKRFRWRRKNEIFIQNPTYHVQTKHKSLANRASNAAAGIRSTYIYIWKY